MKTGNTNLYLAKLAIFIKKRHDGKISYMITKVEMKLLKQCKACISILWKNSEFGCPKLRPLKSIFSNIAWFLYGDLLLLI